MTDPDRDPLIDAFDEFRGQVALRVKPEGVERTRESLRTRKRNVAVGALTLLVVALPVAAQAVLSGEPDGSPAGSPGSPPLPLNSASTGNFVGPGQNVNPSDTAPQGGITEAALYSAELDLPAWPGGSAAGCPTGPVRFQDGDALVGDANIWIAGVAHADVDADGRAETFARVFCMGGPNDAVSRVLAFTPAPGGGVRTLGSVAEQSGDVAAICGVRAGADGAVQVETADFPVPWRCADPESGTERYVTRQWRTFTWNGSAFVQQGSPAHTPNRYATDLELTSTDLVLTRQANGHYVGSMTLTVRNTGSSAIPYKTQTVLSDGMLLVDPPQGCAIDPSWTGGEMESVFCTGAELAGGATRTVTLKIDSPERYQLNYIPDTNVLPLDGYNDPNQANDRAALDIRFQD
ncbi:hypothetical protein AB0M02_36210 [Actinoplanes sp. NPDC051861]|uniref:hypothetical protein n=1 Tax=Actinoplanes sp. NPDC051861 TaxID=3155170 RepID=UPI003441D498